MKNYLISGCSAALIFTTFLLSSCSRPVEGTGSVITKRLDLSEFTMLELDLPASVTVAISDTIQAVVRAQGNIADLIELKKDGDELIIKCKKDYKSSMPVEVILTTRQLERIVVNGSGDVNVVNPVHGEELRTQINGSGDITMPVDVTRLRTEINGSGDITLSGKAAKHRIRMNGSGNVAAENLQSDDCDISINGSGDALLHVNSRLEAKVLGSGNVRYTGAPKVKSEITGSGDISKK
jgi:hypothetical protein